MSFVVDTHMYVLFYCFSVTDQSAMLGLRCLALLFAPLKTKKTGQEHSLHHKDCASKLCGCGRCWVHVLWFSIAK